MSSLGELGYTFRRYYVDLFLKKSAEKFCINKKILDLGGNHLRKRGDFNIRDFSNKVTTANIKKTNGVDIVTNAHNLSIKSSSYEVVICTEVLEHTYNPKKVISEIHRVLKKNGVMIITIPFLYHIHADPDDYCRLTKSFLLKTLIDLKLHRKNIQIEQQGGFYTTLINIIIQVLKYKSSEPVSIFSRLCFFFYKMIHKFSKKIIKLDNNRNNNKINSIFPGGYGIIAKK